MHSGLQNAETDEPLAAGVRVIVSAVKGTTVKVKKERGAAMVGIPIYGIFLMVLIIFFLYNAIKILKRVRTGRHIQARKGAR